MAQDLPEVCLMGPYSLDLRQRIVDAYNNGEGSIRELAERFSVAPNTVQNYLTQVRATGSLAPLPHGGGVGPKIDQAGLEEVRKLVAEKNDRTLAELAQEFEQRQQVPVSIPTMHRALQRLAITRKKKRFERASRIGLPSASAAHSSGGEHEEQAHAASHSLMSSASIEAWRGGTVVRAVGVERTARCRAIPTRRSR